MMKRPPMPKQVETEVLTLSKRKCCLCYGIDGNYAEVAGQIAHLDHNNHNNKIDNLAFLCLKHHSTYDSTTSQHKNYTIGEAKQYRNELYKKLETYPDIDHRRNLRYDINKPFCLEFNGIDQLVKITSDDFGQLNSFCVESIFKLYDLKYAGILLSLDDTKNNSFYCLYYYSSEHKEFPGELHLKYIKESENINEDLASIAIEKLNWEKLRLIFFANKITFELGKQRISTFHKDKNFELNKIQIGGRFWPNQTGSFLASYMSYFKLYDNDKDLIIKDLVFDYGREYFLQLPILDGVELINGVHFSKLIKD